MQNIHRWEWFALAIIAAAFVLIRWPLYAMPGLVLGWNSDAALFGLMARAIRDGWDVPVFFWGQRYLGTLTSLLTAIVGTTPLALRIVAAAEVFAAMLFFWLGLRRTFCREAAMVAMFWLAAGPAFLFHFTIAPIGAEQLLLLCALLFWYSTRPHINWFVLGMLCGFGMWLHQGVLFLIGGIGMALLFERLVTWKRVAVAIAGAALGYLPAAVSLLREDVPLYRRSINAWSLYAVFINFVDTVKSDLWLLLNDDSLPGIAIGVVIAAFAILGLRRGGSWPRGRIIIVSTIAICFGFWILTTYPYPGAVRYIVPVVPLAYGAAAFAITHLRRPIAIALILIIGIGLYVPRIVQARDVAAAKSELYTNWPGSFDPRPVLEELRRGGYRVCYGEVWVAHKLEFLSEPAVRFVPVRSVHRTLPQSLNLIRQPGRKCFVDNDGKVTALSPVEEAQWASTVILRARKAGLCCHPERRARDLGGRQER